MIVAIMQPYFFPYIGYFQLMHAADVFVFLDDVQYIDRGWVNRNQVELEGRLAWLTMPVEKASRDLSINQRKFLLDQGVAPIKRKLQAAYPNKVAAPGWQLIGNLLDFPRANVAGFNENLLREIAGELSIRCELLVSSQLGIDPGLRGQDRIIAICRRLGASHYINPIGGVALYEGQRFLDSGIRLSFLRTTSMPNQSEKGPVHLSIIDDLIRAGVPAARSKLAEFTLQSPCVVP
nr:WbqC family protein [uncultured Pseudoxanthomonas sp.]